MYAILQIEDRRNTRQLIMEIDRLGIDDTISAMGVRGSATTVNSFTFLLVSVVHSLRQNRELFYAFASFISFLL